MPRPTSNRFFSRLDRRLVPADEAGYAIRNHHERYKGSGEHQCEAPNEILITEDIEVSGRGDSEQITEAHHQGNRGRPFHAPINEHADRQFELGDQR